MMTSRQRHAIPAIATAGILLASSQALAAPIDGSIGFGGEFNAFTGADETGSTTTDLSAADSIETIDADTAVIATTGDFTVIPDFTVVDSFADFDIPSDPSELPLSPFWSVSSGGTSFSMEVTSFIISNREGDSFDFDGIGTLSSSATMLDDTPGIIDATFNSTGGELTFSATSTSIPLPATLVLLGGALMGLGLVSRRRV
jgi:hypothetical protein